MVQMNIKDAALIAKIKRLAEQRQTSATEALRIAVDAQIARDERTREDAVQRRFEAIMDIGRRAAALVPPHLRSSDHDDLYDEHGAPK